MLMASLKELRQRRKTVTSIWRMTAAIKMVAQAKLAKAQQQHKNTHGGMDALHAMTCQVHALMQQQEIPLSFWPRLTQVVNPQAPKMLAVMTSDTGMCAGFISKLVKQAVQTVSDITTESSVENAHSPHNSGASALTIMCLGKKGHPPMAKHYPHHCVHVLAHKPAALNAWYTQAVEDFLQGRISQVTLVYSDFKNILVQEPRVLTLLPVTLKAYATGGVTQEGKKGSPRSEPETCGLHPQSSLLATSPMQTPYGRLGFTPDLPGIFDRIVHLYAHMDWVQARNNHTISEHAARMSAMDNAQSNAKDMLNTLKSQYNHLRQSLVTKELIEIISGAQALEV